MTFFLILSVYFFLYIQCSLLYFIYLLLLFFLLCNIILVLPYINMHLPWVYTCSPSCTPLPLPSPYHPSGSSQCTSPKLLVSCIEPGLAIRFLYDILLCVQNIVLNKMNFLNYFKLVISVK